MPPQEREAFELRLIEDEEFSEAVEEEEFDLIDEYAAGALPPAEHKEIKRWIESSPELRTRVLISQRLHSIKPDRKPWRWWLFGVAVVTACLLIIAIARTPRYSASSPTQANAVPPSTNNRQDTVLLAAVRQRGSDNANVPAVYTVHHANTTRLQILLPASTQSEPFTVQLENELPIPNIRPQGAIGGLYLELTFPPGTLHETHYRVTLDSLSEHYEVSFRVAVE